jgi:hypothetical protein
MPFCDALRLSSTWNFLLMIVLIRLFEICGEWNFPATGILLFGDLTPDLPALVLFGVDVEIKFSGH